MENQQEIISITKTIKEVGIDFKLIEALWRSNEREDREGLMGEEKHQNTEFKKPKIPEKKGKRRGKDLIMLGRHLIGLEVESRRFGYEKEDQ